MAARKEFTEAELAKHNKDGDCYLALHELVLNVPKEFLESHPGGPEVLLSLAGKDATQDFEDISHSEDARQQGNQMIIGYMEGASEEAKTKLLPTEKELGGKGGGALVALVPVLLVVIIAVGAYFVMNSQ